MNCFNPTFSPCMNLELDFRFFFKLFVFCFASLVCLMLYMKQLFFRQATKHFSWKSLQSCISKSAVILLLSLCQFEDQGMLNILELLNLDVVTHLEQQEQKLSVFSLDAKAFFFSSLFFLGLHQLIILSLITDDFFEHLPFINSALGTKAHIISSDSSDCGENVAYALWIQKDHVKQSGRSVSSLSC